MLQPDRHSQSILVQFVVRTKLRDLCASHFEAALVKLKYLINSPSLVSKPSFSLIPQATKSQQPPKSNPYDDFLATSVKVDQHATTKDSLSYGALRDWCTSSTSASKRCVSRFRATWYTRITHQYLLANSLAVRTDIDNAWEGGTEKRTDVDNAWGGGTEKRADVDTAWGGGTEKRADADEAWRGGTEKRADVDTAWGGGTEKRPDADEAWRGKTEEV